MTVCNSGCFPSLFNNLVYLHNPNKKWTRVNSASFQLLPKGARWSATTSDDCGHDLEKWVAQKEGTRPKRLQIGNVLLGNQSDLRSGKFLKDFESIWWHFILSPQFSDMIYSNWSQQLHGRQWAYNWKGASKCAVRLAKIEFKWGIDGEKQQDHFLQECIQLQSDLIFLVPVTFKWPDIFWCMLGSPWNWNIRVHPEQQSCEDSTPFSMSHVTQSNWEKRTKTLFLRTGTPKLLVAR